MVRRVNQWLGGTDTDNRQRFTVNRNNSNVVIGDSSNSNATLQVWGAVQIGSGPYMTSIAPTNANYIVGTTHTQLPSATLISSVTPNTLSTMSFVTGSAANLILRFNGSVWGNVLHTLSNLQGVATMASPVTGEVLKFNGTHWANSAAAGVAVLDDLTDVVITSVANNQFLLYNGSNWVNIPYRINTAGDVKITGPGANSILRHDGTNWVNVLHTLSNAQGVAMATLANAQILLHDGTVWRNVPLRVNTAADVSITGPVANSILRHNGTVWANVLHTLSNLQGVATMGSPVSGEVLKFNGTHWANSATGGGVSALDDLSDVVITSAANNQFLLYNGTNWVNIPYRINTAGDVSITSPIRGNALQWSFASSKWTNAAKDQLNFKTDFGGLSDGTDQAATLLGAITAVGANNGILFIPAGRYNIASQVVTVGVNNFTMIGEQGTELFRGSQQAILVFDKDSCNNIVRGIRFNGNKSNFTGSNSAVVVFGPYNTFYQNKFFRANGHGIAFSEQFINPIYSKAIENEAYENEQIGITFANAHYSIAAYNYTHDNRLEGLTIDSGTGTGADYNLVIGNHSNTDCLTGGTGGIAFEGSRGSRIIGNYVHDNPVGGIVFQNNVDKSDFNIITENVLERNLVDIWLKTTGSNPSNNNIVSLNQCRSNITIRVDSNSNNNIIVNNFTNAAPIITGAINTVTDNLDSVSDVAISTPTLGNSLKFNGTTWINRASNVIDALDYGVYPGVDHVTDNLKRALSNAELQRATVVLPAGTIFLDNTITVYSYTGLQGQGIDKTILFLRNSSNMKAGRGLIESNAYSTLKDGFSANGVHHFQLRDLSLDLNYQNNANGLGVAIYGRQNFLSDFKITYAAERGMHSQWGGTAAGFDDVTAERSDPFGESIIKNFFIGYCRGNGIDFDGPHDSYISTGVVALVDHGNTNANTGIWIGGRAAGSYLDKLHSWGNYQKYGFYIDGGFITAVSCESDAAAHTQIVLNNSYIQWVSGASVGGYSVANGQSKNQRGFLLGDTRTIYYPTIIASMENIANGFVNFSNVGNFGGTVRISGYIDTFLQTGTTSQETFGYKGTIPSSFYTDLYFSGANSNSTSSQNPQAFHTLGVWDITDPNTGIDLQGSNIRMFRSGAVGPIVGTAGNLSLGYTTFPNDGYRLTVNGIANAQSHAGFSTSTSIAPIDGRTTVGAVWLGLFKSSGATNDSGFWLEDTNGNVQMVLRASDTSIKALFSANSAQSSFLNAGNFGLGTITPNDKLTIVSGNSNVATSGFGYKFPDTSFLKTANFVSFVIAMSDETTSLAMTNNVSFRMPHAMKVTNVRASLTTASTSGNVTVDVFESGTSIFGTDKLVINQQSRTTGNSIVTTTISDSSLADDAEMWCNVKLVGTGAKGLKVTLIGSIT